MDAISVRLDQPTLRALAQLEAMGMSRSEAIRKAIVQAAQAQRHRKNLVVEASTLEADEEDRKEMLEVASFMESLRAQG